MSGLISRLDSLADGAEDAGVAGFSHHVRLLYILAKDLALLSHVDVADECGFRAAWVDLDFGADHDGVAVHVAAPGCLSGAAAVFDKADRAVVGGSIEAESIFGEDGDGGLADEREVAAVDGGSGILASARWTEANGGAAIQGEPCESYRRESKEAKGAVVMQAWQCEARRASRRGTTTTWRARALHSC